MTPSLIALAYVVDLLVGDPPRLPHPVRLLGALIARLEARLRAGTTHLKAAGVLLAASISLGALVVGFLITRLAGQASGWSGLPGFLLLLYLTASTLATRELLLRVREVLRCDDLTRARELVSHIVGRDTAGLDLAGVRRAALETLAENASDGIVAPLLYLGLGGLPLALAYKAVNTLDSMVGYRHEKYRDLGWASARLDDLCNFLPARLTAGLIVLATWLLDRGQAARARAAWRITRRDGRNHASPNSGFPEAALAGALGIRMGGPASYFGTVVAKPFLGEERGQELGAVGSDALRIILAASLLAVLLAMGLAALRGGL